MSHDGQPDDRPYWEVYLREDEAVTRPPDGRRAAGWEPPRPRLLRRRPWWSRRVSTVVLAIAVLTGISGSSAEVSACRAGIPAYFYPAAEDTHWPRTPTLSARTLLVVNPANGPGTAVDPRYVAALQVALRSRPVLYGYVDTAYGTRPAEVVRRETQLWRDWYQVEGIFLDQTSAGARDVPYYAGLTDWLHSAGFDVALNPGQPQLDRRYLDMAEHVVTFEGPYEQYLQQRFPRPKRSPAGRRTWHLVYDVPDRQGMREVVGLARSRGARMIYVTDGVMPNPWDRLPHYWPEEQQLLNGC